MDDYKFQTLYSPRSHFQELPTNEMNLSCRQHSGCTSLHTAQNKLVRAPQLHFHLMFHIYVNGAHKELNIWATLKQFYKHGVLFQTHIFFYSVKQLHMPKNCSNGLAKSLLHLTYAFLNVLIIINM